MEKLAYIGKIVAIDPIQGADFIDSATVDCVTGGKWRGVVKKGVFDLGALCTVYLPDAVILPSRELSFMENCNWRVIMRRFKGAPSEVLITTLHLDGEAGLDCTKALGVTKYHKPVPSSLQGKVLGEFPKFIPKTDEPNWQSGEGQDLVEALEGKAYYITEKLDGSSTTAYKLDGHFGVCSRNWELESDDENGYWKVARKYNLQEMLPDGYAIQWETCGPKIQINSLGLQEVDGFAFSAYDIREKRYLEMHEFLFLCQRIGMPTCETVDMASCFRKQGIEHLGKGFYSNGKPREGVVVRSIANHLGYRPISFKVINLDYNNN